MRRAQAYGRSGRLHLCALALLLAALATPARSAQAAPVITIIGLRSNSLAFFAANNPASITTIVPINGLQSGESILAIDFRPLTGQLYGLGITSGPSASTGRLYTINPVTGDATPVAVGGAPFSSSLTNGASYGFDFNPAADRIRVISSLDLNLRLHPDTGLILATDPNVANAANAESLTGVAYDRNYRGSTATTLFAIDFATDSLVMVGGVNGTPSPNGGVITPIGQLNVVTGTHSGFDISGYNGVAYAYFVVTGIHSLYTINLSTGAATSIGMIGPGSQAYDGIAVVPVWQSFVPMLRK